MKGRKAFHLLLLFGLAHICLTIRTKQTNTNNKQQEQLLQQHQQERHSPPRGVIPSQESKSLFHSLPPSFFFNLSLVSFPPSHSPTPTQQLNRKLDLFNDTFALTTHSANALYCNINLQVPVACSLFTLKTSL
ncbi:MAG: hypothetical protein BYD32DRAFT_248015 [Podila humilis]|nr:MAG: hypothetical protein BYD32DRAFT_248015 [Podila humilis]